MPIEVDPIMRMDGELSRIQPPMHREEKAVLKTEEKTLLPHRQIEEEIMLLRQEEKALQQTLERIPPQKKNKILGKITLVEIILHRRRPVQIEENQSILKAGTPLLQRRIKIIIEGDPRQEEEDDKKNRDSYIAYRDFLF